MPESVRVVTVRELVDSGILDRPMDGNHGEIHPKGDDFVSAGVPFITAADIKDGRVDIRGCAFISEMQAKSLRKGFAMLGDVLLTHKASVGRTAIVDELPAGLDWIILTPQVTYYRVLNRDVLDRRYLKYYFDSPDFQAVLEAWSGGGSTRAYLGITKQLDLPISLPAIETQRAIAEVLGSLDDKIEQNRRTARKLEALARAVFKAWFVDFEPVKAKAAGQTPAGMDPATAELFPSEFEDSALGEIPKGWKISTVAAEFLLTMGQSPPGSTYNEDGEGMPFYQGRTDFGFRFPTRRVYCTAPTRLANVGDTLVSVRAPVGDLNIAEERCAIGRGVAAVRHRSGSRSLTYYAMETFRERFNHFEGEGTVFGSINRNDFEQLTFLAPSTKLVKRFDQFASPIDDAVENNERQSRTLAALRDAMLPKLLSGELSVTDAEREVES